LLRLELELTKGLAFCSEASCEKLSFLILIYVFYNSLVFCIDNSILNLGKEMQKMLD
jgi:hypothetical protein